MGWYNSDGLYVKFGTEEATVGKFGTYRMAGPVQMAELVIGDLTALSSSAVTQGYTLALPKDARIEEVEVEVITACTSGGSATLDVGLIKTNTSTELDYNGLVAAAAVATLSTAGKRLNLINGSTAAGALIGTTLADNGYFTVNYNTAAFTAGKVVVRVKFSKVVS